VCKIAQASKNSDSNAQHFLSDLLTHSWFHSMLFALPSYQFPYIVVNRWLYLKLSPVPFLLLLLQLGCKKPTLVPKIPQSPSSCCCSSYLNLHRFLHGFLHNVAARARWERRDCVSFCKNIEPIAQARTIYMVPCATYYPPPLLASCCLRVSLPNLPKTAFERSSQIRRLDKEKVVFPMVDPIVRVLSL